MDVEAVHRNLTETETKEQLMQGNMALGKEEANQCSNQQAQEVHSSSGHAHSDVSAKRKLPVFNEDMLEGRMRKHQDIKSDDISENVWLDPPVLRLGSMGLNAVNKGSKPGLKWTPSCVRIFSGVRATVKLPLCNQHTVEGHMSNQPPKVVHSGCVSGVSAKWKGKLPVCNQDMVEGHMSKHLVIKSPYIPGVEGEQEAGMIWEQDAERNKESLLQALLVQHSVHKAEPEIKLASGILVIMGNSKEVWSATQNQLPSPRQLIYSRDLSSDDLGKKGKLPVCKEGLIHGPLNASNNLKGGKSVNVIDLDGDNKNLPWTIIAYPKKRIAFSTGFVNYAKSHNLKAGDKVMLFEGIKPLRSGDLKIVYKDMGGELSIQFERVG